MFNPYKTGEWALYKGQIVRVLAIHHKAPYRVQISVDTSETMGYIDWVHNSTLTPVAPAVSSILSSLNTTTER